MKEHVPRNWDDITPHWITQAIAVHHPDAVVDDIRIVMRDDGTNRRLRLALSYAAGAGPDSLFLKANEPAHRSIHLRNGNLFNEAQLFSSGVPLVVDHPRVYKAMLDREEASFLLVMEDLTHRGADPRDAMRPLSVDQVARGLRGLARLHSAYWAYSQASYPQLDWVQTWAPTEGWQIGLRKRIPVGLERGKDVLPVAVAQLRGDEILGLWVRYVASLSSGPTTLLHGDAHIGNTYVLSDDEVGFLDWQVVRRGNWSQDVGYFLVGALTEDDRRRNERELLEEYRRSLTLAEAERPTKEDAWLRYQTTPAYGLAVWLSTLGTDGWQSREISLTLVQRYACAFVELETRAVLDRTGV